MADQGSDESDYSYNDHKCPDAFLISVVVVVQSNQIVSRPRHTDVDADLSGHVIGLVIANGLESEDARIAAIILRVRELERLLDVHQLKIVVEFRWCDFDAFVSVKIERFTRSRFEIVLNVQCPVFVCCDALKGEVINSITCKILVEALCIFGLNSNKLIRAVGTNEAFVTLVLSI